MYGAELQMRCKRKGQGQLEKDHARTRMLKRNTNSYQDTVLICTVSNDKCYCTHK